MPTRLPQVLAITLVSLIIAQTLGDDPDPMPPQLITDAYAACLAGADTGGPLVKPDKKAIRDKHGLTEFDMAIIHLAFYTGQRYGGMLEDKFQEPAYQRWSVPFWPQEAIVADAIDEAEQEGKAITPALVFRAGYDACGDAWCALLVGHNTLRTLGRWETGVTEDGRDLNPTWFNERKDYWTERQSALQAALVPLRVDGGGDRWGEMYHGFGMMVWTLHESCIKPPRPRAVVKSEGDLVAELQKVVAPVTPEKLSCDHDHVSVIDLWTHGEFPEKLSTGACDARETYVLPEEAGLGHEMESQQDKSLTCWSVEDLEQLLGAPAGVQSWSQVTRPGGEVVFVPSYDRRCA